MYDNSNNHSNWVLLSALLLIFASPVQAASVSASSAVVYEEGGNSRVVVSGPSGAGPSATGYTSNLVPGSAASGYGQASYGALHASAFSSATNIGFHTTETRGQGTAGWFDTITFSSPTLTGQAFARASFSLNGGLSSYSGTTAVGAVGNSTVNAIVRIDGGTTVFSTTGQLVSRNGAITTNVMERGEALNGAYYGKEPVTGLTGVFSFDIPFVFGTPFWMHADLTAFTQTLASATGDQASAYSNFGSSGYWGGISGVHLADGTVLSGYSLSSQSGFNWNNAYSPVPVPAAVWLLGSGLLGLVGVARRKYVA